MGERKRETGLTRRVERLFVFVSSCCSITLPGTRRGTPYSWPSPWRSCGFCGGPNELRQSFNRGLRGELLLEIEGGIMYAVAGEKAFEPFGPGRSTTWWELCRRGPQTFAEGTTCAPERHLEPNSWETPKVIGAFVLVLSQVVAVPSRSREW